MNGHANRDQIKRELVHTVAERYSRQGDEMVVSTVVVHPGPKAWKEVSLLIFPDSETGEIHRRELKAQTWRAIPRAQGGGYDFAESEYHWHCEDHEIEALRVFLNNELPAPGKYRLILQGSELGELLNQVERGEVPLAHAVRLIELAGCAPDMVAALAASRSGTLLAEAVELQRRRDQLDELQRIVEDPDTTERDHIHPQLKKMGWIFGGRYVGESKRRQLTTGDVLDVPLLRGDGSLHVVELKGANIPNLIRRYRGPTFPQEVGGRREELPLIVGTEVHEAMGQAMNYLCHLDEDRDHILARFKIEARRASATVLIGHPKFVATPFSDEEIAGALRTYNSHHSRIEVMHYGELIENAEHALALATAAPDDQEHDPEVNGEPLGIAEPTHELDPWATEPARDPYSDEPPF